MVIVYSSSDRQEEDSVQKRPVKKESPVKPVREMSLTARGKEIRRLREEILRWVRVYHKNGNERCHEVDERLANSVGLSLYKNRTRRRMAASEFEGCCKAYIRRECRAGRLIDDN